MRKRTKIILISVAAVFLIALGALALVRHAYSPGSYVGLPESQAVERAIDRGLGARIVERDGVPLFITDDNRNDRINFTIENSRVIKAEVY